VTGQLEAARCCLRDPLRRRVDVDGSPALRHTRRPFLVGPREGFDIGLEDARQDDRAVVGDVDFNAMRSQADETRHLLALALQGPQCTRPILHTSILALVRGRQFPRRLLFALRPDSHDRLSQILESGASCHRACGALP
jgi:hypothetical protein